jgi:ATP-dependent DNA helicase RecG
VALLTGSVKGRARTELLKQIVSGAAQVVVGTHALFQPAVEFARLGFVVIDEQHRFGVKQRQELLGKSVNFSAETEPEHSKTTQTHSEPAHNSEKESIRNPENSPAEPTDGTTGFMPHLLSMTATPIPRSLQLTLFGDLDISILDELPSGRRPILTQIISPNSRAQMNEKIRAEIMNGRQVYFIAPNISDNGKTETENVENLFRKVGREFGKARQSGDVTATSVTSISGRPDSLAKPQNDKKVSSAAVQIALLHGKMPADKKEKIMRDFAANETQILVATTVIEVGVDVPNASVIVIENADQFGLAQLHQLRGRVGRGAHQSFAFLVQSDSGAPTRRLREIERSNDGFSLAEIDLKIRGAGEIYGTAQHGALNLQIANLADTKLIQRAAAAATDFARQISENPEILSQYKELAREIKKYQRLTTLN